MLARRLWPSECNSLEEGILPRLGIVNGAAHRALSDVGATSAAYLRMRDALLDRFGSEDAFFDRYAGGSRDLHGKSRNPFLRMAGQEARRLGLSDRFRLSWPGPSRSIRLRGRRLTLRPSIRNVGRAGSCTRPSRGLRASKGCTLRTRCPMTSFRPPLTCLPSSTATIVGRFREAMPKTGNAPNGVKASVTTQRENHLQ